MKIKADIGLIGFGYWGKNILRNMFELGVLHTACDSNLETIANFKKQYTTVNFVTDFNEMLDNKDIRAVVIASPAITHHELVKKCLLANKDVLVEKPLSLNTRDGEEIVKLAKEKNRILMVGHILQYHPAIVKLKEMISLGKLGKIRYIYSNRLNIGKLRTEENILWSFAPHDISVILMLLGEDPITVNGFGGDYISSGINDVTMTTLEFKNDVKGHVFVSWIHPYKEQKLVVVGSKGMVVFDDVIKEKLLFYPHLIEWKNGKIPVAQKAEHEIVPVEAGEPLKNELSHFIECVKDRKKPKTDGEEGLKVLKVLENTEKSIKEGKPVKMEEKTKKYFVHETAYIDQDVKIGDGTSIWHFSHVLGGSIIGRNCKIGQNVVIGPKAIIGNGCKIQNNISIYEGVTLEDSVFCGPSCVFTNVFNPRSEILRMGEIRHTLLKKGASIGANSTIVCGNTIGKYAFVGAGSVVTKDVPDYALIYGNPAVIHGWICECGVKLEVKDDAAVCKECKKEYKKENNEVVRIK
jgi:UDP-2-acetamido-3-amino-2,3-dideoxy-glucuronate N-acetyltransferase